MKPPTNGSMSRLSRLFRNAADNAAGAAGVARQRVVEASKSLRQRVAPARPPIEPMPDLPPQPIGLAEDPSRQHTAARPQSLSLNGWWEVLWIVYSQAFSDRLMLVSAGVAFYLMLSIFPALSAVIWFYGLFADPSEVVAHIQSLAFLLPQGAIDIIQQQAMAIAATGRSSMNALIIIGTLVAMWSANAGMKAIIEAMNIIYDEEEKRGLIALNIRSMLFTLGALAIFLTTLAVLILAPILLAFANIEGSFAKVFVVMRWPLLYAITIVYLILLNRYGPSRPKEQARWALWGSALGAGLWLAVSVAFSWYVEHLSDLAATYGSIAAIAGLMLWLWLSALVILIGFELNHELEMRTTRWEKEEIHRQEMAKWEILQKGRGAASPTPVHAGGFFGRFFRR